MSQGSYCQLALEALRKRAEREARQFFHMLVLPAGETIRVPGLGGHGVGHRRVTGKSTFAGQDIATNLPPPAFWPAGLLPATAVVAEQEYSPYMPLNQEPYRVHLFFGDATGVPVLRSLAADILALRPDILNVLSGGKHLDDFAREMLDVLFDPHDCIHGEESATLDAWLCTIHWWAWKATDSPIRVRPKVVLGGTAIEADFMDPAVGEKLSFSYIPQDVFTATAATIDLLIRFLTVPPPLRYHEPYPPPDNPQPGELTTLAPEAADPSSAGGDPVTTETDQSAPAAAASKPAHAGPVPTTDEPVCSDDFTCVVWGGETFHFDIGNQAKAFGVLHRHYLKGGLPVHEKTIGDQIGSGASEFRLAHVYRGKNGAVHPAWGRMIVPGVAKGTFRLKNPGIPE